MNIAIEMETDGIQMLSEVFVFHFQRKNFAQVD